MWGDRRPTAAIGSRPHIFLLTKRLLRLSLLPRTDRLQYPTMHTNSEARRLLDLGLAVSTAQRADAPG